VCTISGISADYQPAPCSSTNPCIPCQNNNPVKIDNTVITSTDLGSVPFYFKYQTDPIGELFGKSQCGELNYVHYMHFYPPTRTLSLNIS
jgi:hypothetical protein